MLPFDLKELIEAVGYIGLFAIVFAESGLFFGFGTFWATLNRELLSARFLDPAIQERLLGKINLLNAVSVVIVIAIAGLWVRRGLNDCRRGRIHSRC